MISLIDKSEAISPFAFRVIFGVIFSLSFFFFYETEESNSEADGHGRTLTSNRRV